MADDAQKRGRSARRKGKRVENAVRKLHEAIGVKAELVPLSGAIGYRGNVFDLDVYARGPDAAPMVAEVKARANGEGFQTLERWLSDADALFLVRDRAEPMVVLPWRIWEEFVSLKGKTNA